MPELEELVSRLNSLVVTKDDIVRVNEEAELIHLEGKPAASAGFASMTKLYRGDLEKAAAVYFRMQALARLLVEDGIPGWTLPAMQDGSIPTEDAVFAAAAVEPLVEIDGDIAFQREPFLDKVLELAESLGTG